MTPFIWKELAFENMLSTPNSEMVIEDKSRFYEICINKNSPSIN